MKLNRKTALNWDYEKARQKLQANCLAMYRGEIGRPPEGDTVIGPAGELHMKQVRALYDGGGDAGQSIDESPGEGEEGSRHGVIANASIFTFILAQRIGDRLTLVRIKDPEITGTTTEADNWKYVRKVSGLDSAWRREQPWGIAMGVAAIRPVLAEGHPPGMETISPQNLWVIPQPQRRTEPMVIIERLTDEENDANLSWRRRVNQDDFPVMVSDMSDPENPSWGTWKTLKDWIAGEPALEEQAGAAYPWRNGEKVRLPYELYAFNPAADSALPDSGSLLNDTLDLLAMAAWIRYVGHVGSFSRTAILTKTALHGMELLMRDPSNLVSLTTDDLDGAKIITIPSEAANLSHLYDVYSRIVDEAGSRYDPTLEVERRLSAESGVALKVRKNERYKKRNQQEDMKRPNDVGCCELLTIAWNLTVRWGWVKGEELPLADDWVVQYPEEDWDEEEKKEKRERLVKDIQMGAKTWVDLELFDAGFDRTDENVAKVMDLFAARKKEAAQLTADGFWPPLRTTRAGDEPAKSEG